MFLLLFYFLLFSFSSFFTNLPFLLISTSSLPIFLKGNFSINYFLPFFMHLLFSHFSPFYFSSLFSFFFPPLSLPSATPLTFLESILLLSFFPPFFSPMLFFLYLLIYFILKFPQGSLKFFSPHLTFFPFYLFFFFTFLFIFYISYSLLNFLPSSVLLCPFQIPFTFLPPILTSLTFFSFEFFVYFQPFLLCFCTSTHFSCSFFLFLSALFTQPLFSFYFFSLPHPPHTLSSLSFLFVLYFFSLSISFSHCPTLVLRSISFFTCYFFCVCVGEREKEGRGVVGSASLFFLSFAPSFYSFLLNLRLFLFSPVFCVFLFVSYHVFFVFPSFVISFLSYILSFSLSSFLFLFLFFLCPEILLSLYAIFFLSSPLSSPTFLILFSSLLLFLLLVLKSSLPFLLSSLLLSHFLSVLFFYLLHFLHLLFP